MAGKFEATWQQKILLGFLIYFIIVTMLTFIDWQSTFGHSPLGNRIQEMVSDTFGLTRQPARVTSWQPSFLAYAIYISLGVLVASFFWWYQARKFQSSAEKVPAGDRNYATRWEELDQKYKKIESEKNKKEKDLKTIDEELKKLEQEKEKARRSHIQTKIKALEEQKNEIEKTLKKEERDVEKAREALKKAEERWETISEELKEEARQLKEEQEKLLRELNEMDGKKQD